MGLKYTNSFKRSQQLSHLNGTIFLFYLDQHPANKSATFTNPHSWKSFENTAKKRLAEELRKPRSK